MPDALPPAVREPFQVNKSRGDGLPIARLPTYGTTSSHPLDAQFAITDVDGYLAAIHASIGDQRALIDGSITEACKALGATPPQAMAYARLSFMPDPANYGLMQWPGMQPESLRKVAQENLLPNMIISSRVTDIRRYSCLSTHPWSPGWKVVLRDATKTPSRSDLADIRDAERFLWNCSRDNVFSDPLDRDAGRISQFEEFLCGAMNDIMTFDGWSIWKDTDYAGRIRKFTNLPAGLIRLALPGKGYKGFPDLYAAMVDETGSVVQAFTREDMTWCVQYNRNDPATIGYGWPTIEKAVRVVQGYQAAVDLNVSTFDKNGIPNGLLKLKGDFWQQEQIDALQREWTNMKRGVSKMWAMPVIAVPEDGDIELMTFMDLKGEDVRYKDNMNMLTGMYCIIEGFPIKRLGMFASGNRRDNQPSPDESVEIQGVDDPGLPAKLTFIEHRINEYLLQPNWPTLMLQFMAKDPKSDARSYEAKKLAGTWKESRAEADLPDLVKMAPEWAKPMAELMVLCPSDPAMMGTYQALAVETLKDKFGVNDQPESGSQTGTTGAPFPSKTDPAKSQEHGHRAGVRRSSRKEGANARAASAGSAP